MQTGRWTFQPGVVPTLATLALFPLLLALGFWQLERADQKQQMFDAYVARTGLSPIDLNQEISLREAGDAMLWRQCVVSGHYTGGEVFLLDNQVLKGVPGYFVFTPFVIDGTDTWIMVNRGWVPAGNYRDELPEVLTPEGSVVVNGAIHPFPAATMLLGGETAEQVGPGISRMQTMDPGVLEDTLNHKLLPYVILLAASSPTGYVREWPVPGSGMERHMGYAFQWFALAAVLMIIFLSVNLRTGQSNE
jgi:surfeit locus 1 family protein